MLLYRRSEFACVRVLSRRFLHDPRSRRSMCERWLLSSSLFDTSNPLSPSWKKRRRRRRRSSRLYGRDVVGSGGVGRCIIIIGSVFCIPPPTSLFNDDIWRFSSRVEVGVRSRFRLTFCIPSSGHRADEPHCTPGAPSSHEERERGTRVPFVLVSAGRRAAI